MRNDDTFLQGESDTAWIKTARRYENAIFLVNFPPHRQERRLGG